MRNLW